MLALDDNNLLDMRRSLKKAKGTWGGFPRVLAKELVPVPVAGMFYQPLVASWLRIAVSETWIFPLLGLKCLEGFQLRRCAASQACGCGW